MVLAGRDGLQTLAERGQGDTSWNNDFLLGDVFQKVYEISTLPNISNNLIRNYYLLVSVKQGSERASNLTNITQQRSSRVMGEVEPRIGLSVWRVGRGTSICASPASASPLPETGPWLLSRHSPSKC